MKEILMLQMLPCAAEGACVNSTVSCASNASCDSLVSCESIPSQVPNLR